MASPSPLRRTFALGCAPLLPAAAVSASHAGGVLACAVRFDASDGCGRVLRLALVHPRAPHLLRLVPLHAARECVLDFAQPVTRLERTDASRALVVVAGGRDLHTAAALERLVASAVAATAAAAAARPPSSSSGGGAHAYAASGGRIVVPVPPSACACRAAWPVVSARAHPTWLLGADAIADAHGRTFGPRSAWVRHTACAALSRTDLLVGDSDGAVTHYVFPAAEGTSTGSTGSARQRVLLRLATREPVAQIARVADSVLAVGAHGRLALCTARGEVVAEGTAPVPAHALAVALSGLRGTVLCAAPQGVLALSAREPHRAPQLCARGAFHCVVPVEVGGDESGAGATPLCAAVRTDGTVFVLDVPQLISTSGAASDGALSTVAARLAAAGEQQQGLASLAAWLGAVLRVRALAARLRASVAARAPEAPCVAYEAAVRPADARAVLRVVLRNPAGAPALGGRRWSLRTVITQGSTDAPVVHSVPVELGPESVLQEEVPFVLRGCAPFAVASTLVCDADTPADRAARDAALATAHRLYAAGAVPLPVSVLDAVCVCARAPPAALEIALPVPAARRVFTATDFLVDARGAVAPAASGDGAGGSERDTFVVSVRGVDPALLLGACGPRSVVRRHVAFLPACAAPPVFELELYRPERDVVLRVTLLRGSSDGSSGGGSGDDDAEEARQRRRLLDGMHASVLCRVLQQRCAAGNSAGAAAELRVMLDALQGTRVREACALTAAAQRGEAVPDFAARLHTAVRDAAAGLREMLQVCDTSVPESILL